MRREQRPSADPDPAAASPDAALVARLAAGEEDAFEELVRENAGRMFAVSRRILRSDDEARDVVQEAFVQAFRGLSGFQQQARLSTWLQRIAINASLMRLRTRRRKPEVAIDDLLPTFHDDGHRRDPGPAWRETAVAQIESAETRALVREQIDRLPEDYRTVLMLRDIDGLDTDEVASLLDISPGAVRVRLHRARQALRTLLDPHFASGAH